jgi:hypothetical protein
MEKDMEMALGCAAAIALWYGTNVYVSVLDPGVVCLEFNIGGIQQPTIRVHHGTYVIPKGSQQDLLAALIDY